MSTEKPEEDIEPQDEMVQIDESQIERVEENSLEPVQPPKPKWWKKFKPGHKREVQMQSMQSGYQEVLGLVRSMRDNLDGQMESQKLLLEFMSELPGVADGLKNVGKATEQQKEMLNVIKGQMESNLDHNVAISSSMEKFNDTLFTMDDTTRKILEGARATEDSLKDMLERSERRLVMITTFLIIAILGVGGGFFYFIYNGGIDLEKIRATSSNTAQVENLTTDPDAVEEVEPEVVEALVTNATSQLEEVESVIPSNRIVEVEEIFKEEEELVEAPTNTVQEVSELTIEETEKEVEKPKRKKWLWLFSKKESVDAEEDEKLTDAEESSAGEPDASPEETEYKPAELDLEETEPESESAS